jgi:hypothetical protein
MSQEDDDQQQLQYEEQDQMDENAMGQDYDGGAAEGSAELNKLDLLDQYHQRCQTMEVLPNRCFVRYLEET